MTKRKRPWLKRIILLSLILLFLIAIPGLLGIRWVFHRVPGSYFESNGVRIHYTDEGSGDPLILIHGLAVNADLNWRRNGLIHQLKKDFRVIALDCRGHGLSDKPSEPDYYGDEMGRDVIRLMDHLAIDRAHLAGYSMGGFIALATTIQHPGRIRSLAICAAGWRRPEERGHVYPPYHAPDEKEVLRAQQLASLFPDISRSIRKLGGKLNKRINGDNVAAYKAIRKSFDRIEITESQIKAMSTPLCCLIGAGDGLLPYASNLREVRPDIEFFLLDKANHFTLILFPDFKEKLVTFFLKQKNGTPT